MSVKTNDGYLGIAVQANKGSAVATSTFFVKYDEANLVPEMDRTPLKEGGDDELINTVVKNSHKCPFSFKAIARPQMLAYLYAAILGADTKSGTGDPYTHELTRLAGGRQWLTLYRKVATGVVVRYTDAKIEKIMIEADAGKEVVVTVEGNALSPDILTAEETESYEAGKPFVFYDGEGRYKLGNVATSDIKKFSVSVSILSQDGYQTDGLLMADLPDLKMEIDVAIDLFAGSTARWKNANYNNTNAESKTLFGEKFELDLIYEENTPNDRQFKLEIGKVLWEPVDLPLKGDPEVITETLAGIAVKPAAGDYIKATILNSISDDLA